MKIQNQKLKIHFVLKNQNQKSFLNAILTHINRSNFDFNHALIHLSINEF